MYLHAHRNLKKKKNALSFLKESNLIWDIFYAKIIIRDINRVWLFVTQWATACQAFLSFTIFWNLLKFMSIELVMLSNHLVLCHPLLFLPSVFPSIRVFSNELALHIRWSKYWSFSFSISSSNEYSGLISFRKVNYSEKKQNSRSTSFPSPGSFSLSLLGAGAK